MTLSNCADNGAAYVMWRFTCGRGAQKSVFFNLLLEVLDCTVRTVFKKKKMHVHGMLGKKFIAGRY